MIVCSCNVISRQEIVDVIEDLLYEDCWQLITPGTVYHAMSKRGKCCGCFPHAIDIIVETTRAYHNRIATPEAKIIPFITRIVEEHERCDTMRKLALLAKQRKSAA